MSEKAVIKLFRGLHRSTRVIYLSFAYNEDIIKEVRKIEGVVWSQSKRCWYIDDNEESFKKLFANLKNEFKIDTSDLRSTVTSNSGTKAVQSTKDISYGPVEIRISNSNSNLTIRFLGMFDRSWIDEIKQYGRAVYNRETREWNLYATRQTVDSLSEYFNSLGVDLRIKKSGPAKQVSILREKVGNDIRSRDLSEESSAAIRLLELHLIEKRYSKQTINTYTKHLGFFFRYFSNRLPSDITTDNISEFMTDYVIRLGFSASYQNQMITAIKTYYQLAGDSAPDLGDINRPKRGRPLPHVFSKEEVTRILNSPRNIKHKLILWLIYSCGLRRGEVINIRLDDINNERRILHIKSGKGDTDRIVPLSKVVLERIEEYRSSYHPKNYLFEGQYGDKYTASSVYSVFKTALRRAGIKKDVGVHSLRHSYATHLHESGLDIRYIQELLGHRSSKTTEIYTHVSRRNLGDVRSPIEDLDLH